MSHYKPYPAYKDSGDDWLGKVPVDWAISPLKYRLRLLNEKTSERSNMVSLENIEGWTGRHLETGAEYEGEGIYFQIGDILFGKLRPYLAKVFRAGKSGQAIGDFYVLRPDNGVNPKYAQYWLLSPKAIDRLNGATLGTKMPRVSWDDMGRMPITWPGIDEQITIAAHLDHETARIDALINRKTRFIELLREKRQALITQAVTKGLDPNVKMKDSGVEWLGEVPEHWEVKRLKFIATVQTGVAKGKDTADQKTIEVPYLRVANVQDGYLDLSEVATIEIVASDLSRYLLQPGDVLMNEGGDFDKLGRGHVWNGEIESCIHQNHVFAVRPHGLSSRWLNTFASSSAAQFYFMGRSKQSTNLASISSSNLMELAVPLPPDVEQKAILDKLASVLVRVDSSLQKTERSIELLKERRSALITAAVTGQIDLREAA